MNIVVTFKQSALLVRRTLCYLNYQTNHVMSSFLFFSVSMLRNKNINVATYRTLVTGIIEMFGKDVCFWSSRL